MVNAHSTAEQVLTPARLAAEGDPLAQALVQKVEHARERVTEMAERVKERAIEKKVRFEDDTQAHPLKTVLAAAAAGAGLGIVIGALLARR